MFHMLVAHSVPAAAIVFTVANQSVVPGTLCKELPPMMVDTPGLPQTSFYHLRSLELPGVDGRQDRFSHPTS